MRLELNLADCGVLLHVNEYDVCMDRTVWFRLALFWRSPQPRRHWSLLMDRGGEGSLYFSALIAGKTCIWCWRGPLQRLA
jgi:hypothetical protein